MVAQPGDPEVDNEVIRQLKWMADYRTIDNLDLPTLKKAVRYLGEILGLVIASLATRVQQSGTNGNHNAGN